MQESVPREPLSLRLLRRLPVTSPSADPTSGPTGGPTGSPSGSPTADGPAFRLQTDLRIRLQTELQFHLRKPRKICGSPKPRAPSLCRSACPASRRRSACCAACPSTNPFACPTEYPFACPIGYPFACPTGCPLVCPTGCPTGCPFATSRPLGWPYMSSCTADPRAVRPSKATHHGRRRRPVGGPNKAPLASPPLDVGPKCHQLAGPRVDPGQGSLAAGSGTGRPTRQNRAPGALAFGERFAARLARRSPGGSVRGGIGAEILAHVRRHEAGTWVAEAGGARFGAARREPARHDHLRFSRVDSTSGP